MQWSSQWRGLWRWGRRLPGEGWLWVVLFVQLKLSRAGMWRLGFLSVSRVAGQESGVCHGGWRGSPRSEPSWLSSRCSFTGHFCTPAPQPRAGCSPLTGRPPALSSRIPHSTPGSPPAPQISRKHSSQNYTKAHKHFPQKIANLAGDLKEVTCHLVPLTPKWSAISFFPGVGRGVEKGFFKYFLSSCSWEKVPGF